MSFGLARPGRNVFIWVEDFLEAANRLVHISFRPRSSLPSLVRRSEVFGTDRSIGLLYFPHFHEEALEGVLHMKRGRESRPGSGILLDCGWGC